MLRHLARVLVVLVISVGIVGATAVVSSADEVPTPGLSASITLRRHSVVAGRTVQGTVTVRNTTGASVRVMGCNEWFQVVLAGNGVHPALAWLACLGPIDIPAGTTAYPIAVNARYSSCGTMPDSSPPCDGDRPAPLPPGRYEARMYQSPTVVKEPKRVTVKVTAP